MLANDRDTKRPYDEAQLCAGLLTYGAKAYPNAAVCMRTNAEAYINAEAYECKRLSLIPEHLRHASASIEHGIPCETKTIIVSANDNASSMSSQRERIELVASFIVTACGGAWTLVIAEAVRKCPGFRLDGLHSYASALAYASALILIRTAALGYALAPYVNRPAHIGASSYGPLASVVIRPAFVHATMCGLFAP